METDLWEKHSYAVEEKTDKIADERKREQELQEKEATLRLEKEEAERDGRFD